ncbi:MAG: thioesterase family protein [Hellea sp.]
MSKPTPQKLSDYPHKLTIPTRWADNDVYGHVNNSVYYFYFDTVVNKWLMDKGLLEIGTADVVGLVVETSCAYFAPISFPDDVVAGLRVSKLGNSSVRYEIGLFRNDETQASAQGHFVHVYVDEKTRRPVSISDKMRDILKEILG